MKLRRYFTLVILLVSLVILSGCSAQQLSADEVQKFANPLTGNMLLAINEDDYPGFPGILVGFSQITQQLA